jgi:hypothetical protein
LISYQAGIAIDGDGQFEGTVNGVSTGTGTNVLGDCYQNASCPGTNLLVLPKGGFGSLIFQEAMQDATRTWLVDASKTIQLQGTTVPYELGHQFGLLGDNRRTPPVTFIFKIMDYPRYTNNETDDYGLHPEHINILRRRVKSPGE